MNSKENTSSVKIIEGVKLPHEAGLYYRLFCMTGKNKGLSYYISAHRIVMGRSENADVLVFDTKSSRKHAELTLVNDDYVLTDLGSQNGVIVNDLKVTQHKLRDNDKIIIGQTVFKYNKIIIEKKDIITYGDEGDDLEVDDDDFDIEEEAEEEEHQDKVGKKKSKKKPVKKNNRVMILAGILLLLFLFMDEESSSEKRGRRTKSSLGEPTESKVETRKYNDEEIADPDVAAKFKGYLHRGQREYREGNYYRAIEQFELALILVPNHGYASFYRQRAEESLNKYVDKIIVKAENDVAALRYKSAIVQYCSVITFLQDSPQHPKYVEAEKKITEIEAKMGVKEGEFKCF